MRTTSLYAVCTTVAACAFLGTAKAQASYDVAIAQMAASINTSLGLTATATVLVNPFKRMEGEGCDLDELLTGDFEAKLLGAPHSYRLLDRSELMTIAEEHKLAMQGMMDDEQRAREAGKLLKADAIVFGTYRLVGGELLIRVKAIDIQTSEQLAIVPATCVPSTTIKELCKQSSAVPHSPQSSGKEADAGRDAPRKTTPRKNLSSDCRSGSYCFVNSGTQQLYVQLSTVAGSRDLSVGPGETECFTFNGYGTYRFSVTRKETSGARKAVDGGSIVLEKCKTGYYVIE